MLLSEQIGLVRTNYIQGFCYSLDYFDYYEFLSTYYVTKDTSLLDAKVRGTNKHSSYQEQFFG